MSVASDCLRDLRVADFFIIANQPETTASPTYHQKQEELGIDQDGIDEFFENLEVDSAPNNCLPFTGNNVVIVDGDSLEDKLGLTLDQPKNNKRSLRTVQQSDHLPNGTTKKPNTDDDERRAARRKREAQAKKLRRQNETPEQRQRRLALHAERMRKTRANKQQNQAPQQPQQQYVANYEVAHPSAHNQAPEYATATPVQIVAMPQHQASYHQPAPHYRQSHQPTVISVPIPASAASNGPLTIHVTLPENLHLAGQTGQQPMQQIPQQLHLVPQRNSNAGNGQFIVTQDQYGNQHPMHIIQIQTQPSPANHSATSGQQHIIIQPSQQPSHTGTPQSSRQITSAASSSNENRPVPHRNLTDEQIARRRKANAERSRRRRAMETADQRAERNRRTAERMRQRRAKIAEERGIVRQEPKVTTLTSARFEEIFQSVVSKNMEEMDKDDSKDMEHINGGPMSSQHIIVSGSHQIPQQQVVIAPSSQNNVYHQDGQYIYQSTQGEHQPQQRIIVQQSVPNQQMSRI